ncbi:hypothetical protein EI555_007772 [Monodon monoceros]|uniref:Tumor protein D52 n=2 Tax=Cetacea TaxID=9721 RepID=A0A4U1EVR5_MONMO|nr:hypothetical protein EI555_007772 [Monodon monoceros]
MGARSGAALGSESGSGAARGLAPEQVQRLRCLRRELHPPIRIRRPGSRVMIEWAEGQKTAAFWEVGEREMRKRLSMFQYIHLPVGKNVYKWDNIIHTIFYSLPCFLKSDGFIEAMGSEEAQLLKSPEVLNQSLLRTDPVPEEGEDVVATISATETLSEEEREELRRELAKVEEEIQTLSQVLAAKEKHLTEIKRKLGINSLQELKQNIAKGWQDVTATSAYKKTSETLSQAGQKASAAFSSVGSVITKKLEDVKYVLIFPGLIKLRQIKICYHGCCVCRIFLAILVKPLHSAFVSTRALRHPPCGLK